MGRTTDASVVQHREQRQDEVARSRESTAGLGRGARGGLGSPAPRRDDEITKRVSIRANMERGSEPGRAIASLGPRGRVVVLVAVGLGAFFAGLFIAYSGHRSYAIAFASVLVGALVVACGRLLRALEAAERDASVARQEACTSVVERDAAVAHARTAQALLLGASGELRARGRAVVSLAEERSSASETLRASKALLDVLEELGALAEIVSSGTELELSSFDLRETIDDVVASACEPRMRAELVSVIAHDIPRRVRGDARHFRRALENLLVEATERPEGEEILVRAALHEDGTIGIKLRSMGSGEGIRALVSDRLARAMGGSLSVSRRPEGGAELDLRLPLPVEDACGAVDGEATDLMEGTRVVIVDPSATVRRAARELLRRWGASVVEAVRVDEARPLIERAEQEGRPVRLLVFAIEALEGDPSRALRLLGDRPCIVVGPRGAEPRGLPDAARWLDRPIRERSLLRAIREIVPPDARALVRELYRAWATKELHRFRSVAARLETASDGLGATALAQACRRCLELDSLPDRASFLRVMESLVEDAAHEPVSGVRELAANRPRVAATAE